MSYEKFLQSKLTRAIACGIDIPAVELNPMLFDYQRAITSWALRMGRAAIFCDCGLGKTPMQLEWASQVRAHTGGNVLIAAPLAVSHQTAREGNKFNVPVNVCRSQDDVRDGINITNYEMLHHFDASNFTGVALDESSILKSYAGQMRNQIIEMFTETPYRLACTATPAPNDHMELGNHSEFLGVMSRSAMLAQFFVHDGGDTSKWRLKGHAEDEFWKWLCSWAVMVRKPSDIGFGDEGFELPPLEIIEHRIESHDVQDGYLFPVAAQSLMERRQARRKSLQGRVEAAVATVGMTDESWCLWCDLNDEADALESAIPGAVQISGSDKPEFKESSMLGFTNGEISTLVTKPSICGFGMNWQHCNHVAFVGLSDSYEQFYQAVRRFWRFGQTKPVQCHVFVSEAEGAVVANIKRKEADAQRMAAEMVSHMKPLHENITPTQAKSNEYARTTRYGENWTAHLGDCVEVVKEMEPQSIDFSIFSPPFASLYTYSNSERDMGNCRSLDEFFTHFNHLVDELHRVLKDGRLVSIHCFDIPAMKERDGYIGLIDFPALLRAAFERVGFIYHSKVTIWKDPVTAMQRTKALGLLHKTIRKDSSMCRQGIPDYLLTMRKPGANDEPIAHTHDEFPVSLWQQYASPVWMDINPSKTLQKESAREEKDERHICPLQLEVIERALMLWSNPGDLVLSPFMGIGSEGHVSLQMGRRFVGAELKKSYFEQAARNLESVCVAKQQMNIFDEIGVPA